MRRIVPLLGLAFATAGCATDGAQMASAESSGACFFASDVSGFSDAGPDKALVRVGTQRMWELTLSPGCPQVDYALRIGIRARGGTRICSGRNAELLVPYPSGNGFQSCLVQSVRQLSPEEVARAQGRDSAN